MSTPDLEKTYRTSTALLKTMMRPEEFYLGLDPGIRFAVRILHAYCFETCQSCEGGAGHAYPEPTVDLIVSTNDGVIYGALAALVAYGLPVSSISLTWNVQPSGLINEKVGRIIFSETMHGRANEKPTFVHDYHVVPNKQ